MKSVKYITECLLFMLATLKGTAANDVRPDSMMLARIWNYRHTIDTARFDSAATYAYTKFFIDVKRRNLFLLPVPTMYRIAHGPRRKYVGELFSKVIMKGLDKPETHTMVLLTTVPHHKKTMPTMQKYLTPNIYQETIIEDYLLSPFNRINSPYYKYSVLFMLDGTAEVGFSPRFDNTQLVSGSAVVDYETGRIISGHLEGEYDMVKFHLSFTMGTDGRLSLLPTSCRLRSQFDFVGNKITASYDAYYRLPSAINDSIRNREDLRTMAQVRPKPLSRDEATLYQEYYRPIVTKDTTIMNAKKESWAKRVMWDMIGDRLLNKIQTNYGPNNQGLFRINPLFNPLYMGYSKRRGFYYKFDVRSSYDFNDNTRLYARFKSGYSFKQKQFYYRFPIEFYYNKKRGAYLKVELSNGNWVGNGEIQQKAMDILGDSLQPGEKSGYFKDFSVTVVNNFNISDKFGFEFGLIAHRRSAVDKHFYRAAGLNSSYISVAPYLELQYRPLGWNGPVIAADYERSIKGLFGSTMAYERWEFDGQYIHNLNRLRFLSFRLGAGFYTMKSNATYFLDYSNFRENNIPGGWNDDWSGEFELLKHDWYNSSRYYVRANVTYETPLLFTTRIPLVGHFVEKERIYASTLFVTHLHPYTELGYGFTTRWFSTGLFLANRNFKYEGFGIKFGFELFRHW